ncbi:hypothetical protein DFH05DRAFT_1488209 [Lentinula detonsa]|uniref:F-box domain-containing protein n=1 Tax=Lentinula detonsa TaxID=2804962 RepID=A0A9W8P288_9AGAR|nr:hypothetical protein DFH05DRAFT_1488209 [Lentinula detonsa]
MMPVDISNQLDHLAKILRDPMIMESMPRLQLSRTSEREKIRKAIDSGIDILADLKSYRNAIASISFLPDELLTDIFYKVMISEGAWYTRWCRLILVCRRWHRVAMNNGKLWSWISDDDSFEYNGERVEVWQTRSRGYPLSFKFSIDQYSSNLLAQNAHRVRLLELVGHTNDFADFFSRIPNFPMLENLRFSLRSSDEHPVTLVNVPSSLVEGRAPRLRRICLENVVFKSPEELQLLANVTHLELTKSLDHRDLETALPSLKDIHDTIQQSPALQTLIIRHYVSIDIRDIQSFPTISLPDLGLLNLNMDIQIMTAILQFLTFPHTTHTSYIAHPRFDGPLYIRDIKSLIVHVRRHLQHRDAPIIRSAKVESGLYLAFSFFQKDKYPDPMFSDEEPTTFILVYTTTQHENRRIITKIINALPLEKLTTLDATSITHDNHQLKTNYFEQMFSWETWRTLIRLLPVGLTIRIGVNDALLALLRGAIDAMERAPDTVPSGRRLKRLNRRQGIGSLPFSNLVLTASHNLSVYRNGIADTEIQERLYNALLTYLSTYRDLDTKLKPKGKLLETLVFRDLQLSHCYNFAARLHEVTDKLLFGDSVWNPMKIREQERHWRKRMRRARKILGLPDSSSDHFSDDD